MARIFALEVARRSSSVSRIPAASPADTRLQKSASKYFGYLRNAWPSEEPVSTSVLMSSRSLPTDGFAWPRPTMSKACSSGTPAFIITASWRVKMVMSLSVIFLPPPVRTFLIDWTWMPWRRRLAATADSPAARLSPLITFPALSFPVQEKLYCLTSAAGFFATAAMVVSLLLVGDALDLFQRREPLLHLDQARHAQVLDPLPRRLVGQVYRGP